MHDSEMRGLTGRVSRRGFLRVAVGSAVVLPGLLAASAAPSPPASPNVFSNAYNPPSTPLAQNPAWQEVNKQLNATVQFTIVAPGDYAAKMGTTMAGDDLPDVMLFPGTQEDLLLQYGLQDVHYTLDGTGKLTLNDKSNVDANYVNWKYMVQHPQVMYVPDIPGFARAEYEAEHFLVAAGVNDPTFGLFSPALGKSGATINRTMLEGITDIIAARRPMADYDQILKDWVGNGGDQIRKELTDGLAAAK